MKKLSKSEISRIQKAEAVQMLLDEGIIGERTIIDEIELIEDEVRKKITQLTIKCESATGRSLNRLTPPILHTPETALRLRVIAQEVAERGSMPWHKFRFRAVKDLKAGWVEGGGAI